MDYGIRKIIESKFYNFQKIATDNEMQQMNIILENMASDPSNAPGGSGKKGSAVENKALRVIDIWQDKTWVQVVQNTFTTYKFLPEFSIMKALYVDKKSKWHIINNMNVSEATFYRWREIWLHTALYWAEEFGLVIYKNKQYLLSKVDSKNRF